MKAIIYENVNSKRACEVALQGIRELVSLDVHCYVSGSLYSCLNSDFLHPLDTNTSNVDADCIISFGGDGTMLRAIRQYYHQVIPIMGFNVGRMGFLAEYLPADLRIGLESLVLGNYKISERTTLKISHNEKIDYCLNDIVLKGTSKMSVISAFVDEQHIGDYKADGLIIATSTGSSAYSLSCGGPLLSPDSDVFCITPIAPHSLTLRPLVVSEQRIITLYVKPSNNDSDNDLIADGEHIGVVLPEQQVTITRSPIKTKIIVPQQSTYFNVLRKKLLWASGGE